MDDDADGRSHVERAIDACVVAPIGVALSARSLLPKLVAKGRDQVRVAWVVGEFAVRKGAAKAEDALGQVQQQAADLLRQGGQPDGPPGQTADGADGSTGDTGGGRGGRPGGGPGDGTGDPGRQPASVPDHLAGGDLAEQGTDRQQGAAHQPGSDLAGGGTAGGGDRQLGADGIDGAGRPVEGTWAAPTGGSAIDPATLAIPDYDSLSASQVVPRLESLAPDELQAIGDYEAATRARRTILSKIAQLRPG